MFDLKNSIDYYIRSITKFSRKNFSEDLELTKDINDYMFDVLSKTFEIPFNENLKVLDIGSKNWEYVRGQHSFFKQHCNSLKLDGVEIDAYRLYSNFYSRYETAKFYIKNLDGANYYPCDVLDIKEKYDYITWFLPFVTKFPLKKWGLPQSKFMPERLLSHVYGLLKNKMLIVNQGEVEAQIQEELLKKLNIPYKYLGVIKSDTYEFKNERHGFIISANI